MAFGRAKEDRPTPRQVYGWRIYMITLFATLGSWTFGYNNGVIGGVLVLPSFLSDFNLPPVDSSEYTNIVANIVSFLQIGALVGSCIVFPVVKYLGRKVSLIVAGAIFFAGTAMQVFAHGSLDLIYAGRTISGVGLGFVTVLVPMYIAEMSPPAIRGSLVGLWEVSNQIASLTAFWCNYLVTLGIPADQSRQWQIPLAMQLIPAGLLCVSAAVILPESPRWLIAQGKVARARKVLSFARNLNPDHEYINYEIEQVEEALERQRRMLEGADRWQLFRELTWKGNRNRLIIGCLLMYGANCTGINGVNFYTPTIFKSIGFTDTRTILLLSGFFAVAKSSATFVSLFFFIDKAGRRTLLLVASFGINISLLYIGAFVTATHGGGGQKTAAGYVAMVATYVYAASFSMAWNGVPWVYCSEIFPARLKEICICLTTWNQWLAQFAVARISPYLLNVAYGSPFFYVFAGLGIISAVMVFFWLPETKGKTLEGMDEVFGSPYKHIHQENIQMQDDGAPVVRLNSTV